MSENTQGLFNPQGDEYTVDREDEEIFFAEEIEVSRCEKSWKILIVDDDVEVHEVTKLALSEFTFEGRSLTFISAYSGREAKHLIQSHPDTAIIFLDVVMETENSGLQVTKYIREELGNSLVRIILRTGQPGQAPEDVVAVNYGIDDYKTKTELTSQKLFITVVTALRAFSTLMQMLEMSRTLELELVQYRQVKVRGHERGHEQREKLQLLSDQADASYTMSAIARIARMVLRIADEHSAKLGISQNKLAVLIYLSTEPERRASPSSLAKHCGVSRAAMTGLLDGLEQDGYVERDDHPSDRRALMVKLTWKGQQFLDWIAPRDRYHLSELVSLNEVERQKLIELVMKVIELSDETVTQITN